jgi:hypothetical protein
LYRCLHQYRTFLLRPRLHSLQSVETWQRSFIQCIHLLCKFVCELVISFISLSQTRHSDTLILHLVSRWTFTGAEDEKKRKNHDRASASFSRTARLKPTLSMRSVASATSNATLDESMSESGIVYIWGKAIESCDIFGNDLAPEDPSLPMRWPNVCNARSVALSSQAIYIIQDLPYFGVELDELMKFESGPVPWLVESCITALESNSMSNDQQRWRDGTGGVLIRPSGICCRSSAK